MKCIAVGVLSAALLVVGTGTASGQAFPSKPIRIVTGEAGGGIDLVARLVAQGISAPLGQAVIVENRPVSIATEIVAKALPDGYSLVLFGTYPNWVLPFLQKNAPYDAVRDFSPVTTVASAPSILVVNSSVPVKSVKELIALAKSKPGDLNYGSSAIGGSPQLAVELFKAMAGVNIVAIQYKGAGPAINALLGGEVQLMIASTGSVTPHVKSGRVKALAVTSAQPSELAPGLPTVAASGVPGYEMVTILSLFTPAKTPAAIINRLNQEIVRMLSVADVKKRFINDGLEVVTSSPAELTIRMKSEMARMGKVIKDAGIHTD